MYNVFKNVLWQPHILKYMVGIPKKYSLVPKESNVTLVPDMTLTWQSIRMYSLLVQLKKEEQS